MFHPILRFKCWLYNICYKHKTKKDISPLSGYSYCMFCAIDKRAKTVAHYSKIDSRNDKIIEELKEL